MTSAPDSGGSKLPPPDLAGISEHPEFPHSDRELAEKISRHYGADLPGNPELIGALETTIRTMDPEDRRSLARWVHEIDHHTTFFESGRYMTDPDEKILTQHMKQRMRIADEMYALILAHTTKERAKMKTADGKAITVNESAFRISDDDIPERLRIENKVDAIKERIGNGEKIPTGQEIGEWKAFLQTVLDHGIDVSKDQAGVTRARVQYLLASVESLKNLNKVAISRRRLLEMEGGQWLVEHGALNPDGSIPPRVWKNGEEPLRDPVALGARAVVLVAASLYAVLSGISFAQKKDRGPLDAAWPLITGLIAAKAAGLFQAPLDELDKIRLNDLSPEFTHDVLEPASVAQTVMNEDSREVYARMGGRNVAADSAQELEKTLIDGEKRDALSLALRTEGITDTFLTEFAGRDSSLAQSLTPLEMKDRVLFLNTMENPLDPSRREQWFTAVDTVLRHPLV